MSPDTLEIRISRLEEKYIASSNALVIADQRLKDINVHFEKRLDEVGKLHDTLCDQMGTFVTRKDLDEILREIKEDKRSGISMWISIVALAISVLFSIFGFFKQGGIG